MVVKSRSQELKRGSGILLHVTSLPSDFGIGDLGPGAYRFVDSLAHTKQAYWQVLPLNPTIGACGHSPYSSTSAFAGNALLISPELLLQEGLLTERDLNPRPDFIYNVCDYDKVVAYKEKLLHRAYEHFKVSRKYTSEFKNFCRQQESWLDDFVLFSAIRQEHNEKTWDTWDIALRDWRPEALGEIKKELAAEIEKEKFLQFIFFKQWFALKTYCNKKGISIIGDIPIYVNYDSADVWAHTNIFKLDANKQPTHVAGVPPDYFSVTGQLWGNPVYRWNKLKELKFDWWVQRIKHNLSCFDYIRIDHFRGLIAYWEVKYGESTAVNGQWRRVPASDFFNTLFKQCGSLPIIAEDLGLITPDVRQACKRLGFPGMKVLLFAFGEDNARHPYLPHVFEENCVVYTGTHDNNTARGWFEQEATPDEKNRLFRYLGRHMSSEEIHRALMRIASSSVARLSLFPLQDVLGLDASARMNIPSVPHGNWWWRFADEQLNEEVREALREMTVTYGRAAHNGR